MNRAVKKHGFQRRVAVAIVTVGMLSVLLGLASVYVFGRAALEKTIGTTYQELAEVTAANINKEISNHLLLGHTLALSRDVVRVVAESNNSYEGSTHQEITQQLNTIESRWAKDQGVGAYLHALLTNEATTYLRSFDNKLAGAKLSHLQILVTDARGAVVAATKKPNHYTYAKQEWWQQVMQTGLPYLGDIIFSKDHNSFIFPVALPIKRNHDQVDGVLYTIYNAPVFFKQITDVKLGRTDHTMLVSSDGEIIFCPILPIKVHRLSQPLQALALREVPGWVASSEDVHYPGTHAINGFAPVAITFSGSGNNFGGKHWYILTSQDPDEAFAPIYDLLGWVAIVGLLGSLLVTVLGYLAARRVIRPINLLRDGVEILANGNLDHSIKVNSNDEVEDLAQAFNQMSEKLSASYSGLEAKITERTRELETKNRELFTLYTIVSALNEAHDSHAGFTDALNKVMVTLRVQAVALTTLTPPKDTCVVPKGKLDPAGCRQAIATFEEHILQRGQPLFIEDLSHNPRFNLLERDLGYRGVAVLPITIKRRHVGILYLLTNEPRVYSPTEQALITSIIKQFGVSIEHLSHL